MFVPFFLFMKETNLEDLFRAYQTLSVESSFMGRFLFPTASKEVNNFYRAALFWDGLLVRRWPLGQPVWNVVMITNHMLRAYVGRLSSEDTSKVLPCPQTKLSGEIVTGCLHLIKHLQDEMHQTLKLWPHWCQTNYIRHLKLNTMWSHTVFNKGSTVDRERTERFRFMFSFIFIEICKG